MHRADLPRGNHYVKAGAKPVKEEAMRLIGVFGQDESVPCATCNHAWDVNYLMRDIGRERLRGEGFAAIVFDDGAVMVNWCPQCDVPAMARVKLPVRELHMAA